MIIIIITVFQKILIKQIPWHKEPLGVCRNIPLGWLCTSEVTMLLDGKARGGAEVDSCEVGPGWTGGRKELGV